MTGFVAPAKPREQGSHKEAPVADDLDGAAEHGFPDDWAVAEGYWDETPAIVRVRTGLDEWVADPTLPERVVVTWSYDPEQDSGFPMAGDLTAMQEFEDRLVEALETPAVALLTAVVTHKGNREWIFYSTKIDEFMALLNEEFAEDPHFPLEIYRTEDPHWEQYREIVDSMNGASSEGLDDEDDDSDADEGLDDADDDDDESRA